MKKKLIGIILCVMAIMCISAITAFADEAYTYKDGVLTINTNDGLSSWPSTVDSSNVTSIVIGSNVTDAAGFSSLNGCSNVVNITFKNSATVSGGFSGLLSLTTVTFEEDCTVSNYAFGGCSSLETIIFKGECNLSNAFSGLYNLTTVTFEKGCTVSSAFSGCSNLETITFKGTSNLSSSFSSSCSIKKITFGGATTIGEGVFSGSNSPNTVLTELVFPAGSKIQSNAFQYYTGLTSITFDGDITLEKDANAYYISPFYSCTGLKSVEFKGTSTLSGSAFYGCTALESVIFNGASTISGNAFSGCTALESVEFKGTSTLSGAAFQGSGASLKNLSFGGATTITSSGVLSCGSGNTTLTKLVFPTDSTLPQAAFQSYTGLETVTFEGSVTLGAHIFPACSQLNDFYFNSTDASSISLDNETFKQLADTINIYVPNETAVEAYKNQLTNAGTASAKYANCVKTNAEHATHNWSNGACSICNIACKHADSADTISDWITDSNQHWKVYSTCGAKSDLGNHSWSKGVCSTCSLACTHNWSEGACSICSLACSHSWSNGVCSICRLVCTHVDEAKQWAYNETQHWEVYSTCGAKTDPANHEYGTDNKCTSCGYTKPVATYSGGGGISTQKPTVTTPENGKVTLSSNGRTATITPEEGYQVASVTVNGVDKGKVTELTGLKTGDEVIVTFEKTKETLDKEASEAVGALSSMKARSSRTAKGNVKVVMNLSSTEKAKLAELKAQGYTVKYKFYRSTKKSSGYTAMKTGTTGTYYNTIGKVGKMYYYKARVMVYDQDGKLVASTKLSDCKYANRTWTKK